MNRKLMKPLLTFVLLLIVCAASRAQTDSTYTFGRSPFFAHAEIGTIIIINLELSGAVGYRFHKSLGLGVEYRSTAVHNSSFGSSAKVIGLHLRGHFDSGLYTSFGAGVLLSASRGDDGFFEYTYREGGSYLAVDLGYQFRSGITLGAFVTGTGGQTFDVAEYNIDSGNYEPTNEILDEGLLNLGFKIGYAFPLRAKRR